MKFLQVYQDKLGVSNTEEMFSYYLRNLTHTIYDWNFLVGWYKISVNMKKREEGLMLLNDLIGSENLEVEFKELLKKKPEIIPLLPILFAYRKDTLKLRHETEPSVFRIVEYYFKNSKKCISDKELNKLMTFLKNSGVLSLFNGKKISNFKDYAFGVEVGLDSNARKNRGGVCMEDAVEEYLKGFCVKHNLKYASQAGYKKIKEELDYDVHVDIQDHIFDFAVKSKNKILLIETNFYSGGGGTLKRVCGEFQNLSAFVKENHTDAEFVWVTDGLGWETCKGHFEEAYNNLDYVFNLKLLETGVLEQLL